jgi:hypothetical protein
LIFSFFLSILKKEKRMHFRVIDGRPQLTETLQLIDDITLHVGTVISRNSILNQGTYLSVQESGLKTVPAIPYYLSSTSLQEPYKLTENYVNKGAIIASAGSILIPGTQFQTGQIFEAQSLPAYVGGEIDIIGGDQFSWHEAIINVDGVYPTIIPPIPAAGPSVTPGGGAGGLTADEISALIASILASQFGINPLTGLGTNNPCGKPVKCCKEKGKEKEKEKECCVDPCLEKSVDKLKRHDEKQDKDIATLKQSVDKQSEDISTLEEKVEKQGEAVVILGNVVNEQGEDIQEVKCEVNDLKKKVKLQGEELKEDISLLAVNVKHDRLKDKEAELEKYQSLTPIFMKQINDRKVALDIIHASLRDHHDPFYVKSQEKNISLINLQIETLSRQLKKNAKAIKETEEEISSLKDFISQFEALI